MQKSTIAASVMKASGGKPVLVFSSMVPASASTYEAIRSAQYSTFSCKACKTDMLASASSHPFCITCGADESKVVKADTKLLKASIKDEAELHSLKCSKCDLSTVVTSGVVNALTAPGHPIHCSGCGSEMYPVTEATNLKASGDEEIVEDEESLSDDIQLAELDEIEAEADEDLGITDADLEASGEGEDWPFQQKASGDEEIEAELDEITIDTDSVESTADDLEITEPLKADGAEVEEPVEEASEDISEDDDIALEPFTIDDEASDGASDEEATEPTLDDDEDALAAEAEDIPFEEPLEGDALVDAMDVDDSDAALAFVQAGNRLVAMKAHVAVASLSKEGAGKNADLLFNPALTAAASNAVKAHGLRKGLKSLGFKMTLVPVTTKAAVAREVQKIQAAAQKQETDRKQDFANAYALASVGMNRGSWKGVENPLKAAFEAEFARLGVTNPKRLTSAIFNETGLAYSKNLLEVTSKLLKVSASTRAEYAEMFDMTASVQADPQTEDEGEDEELDVSSATSIQSRFRTAALLRPPMEQVTASGKSTTAADILAGKAELQFSSF